MALTRRQAILGTGLAGAVALAGRSGADAPPTGRVVTKGRLKQSVSWWCYQRIRAEGRDRVGSRRVADRGRMTLTA